jgi:Family of unknown function (DUF5565)
VQADGGGAISVFTAMVWGSEAQAVRAMQTRVAASRRTGIGFSRKKEDAMKKIPTAFERDWNGDRSRVTPHVHAGCEWVLDGEGVAMRKIDGTSCLVRGGQLFKRRELRKGDSTPPLFEQADLDEETGKTVGWVPCDIGPEDRYHMEAFEAQPDLPDGTYELLGPKVQGNPERRDAHVLVSHSDAGLVLKGVPRTFEELRDWMASQDIEGVVWHHSDGRMAKLKLRDFGLKRPK